MVEYKQQKNKKKRDIWDIPIYEYMSDKVFSTYYNLKEKDYDYDISGKGWTIIFDEKFSEDKIDQIFSDLVKHKLDCGLHTEYPDKIKKIVIYKKQQFVDYMYELNTPDMFGKKPKDIELYNVLKKVNKTYKSFFYIIQANVDNLCMLGSFYPFVEDSYTDRFKRDFSKIIEEVDTYKHKEIRFFITRENLVKTFLK